MEEGNAATQPTSHSSKETCRPTSEKAAEHLFKKDPMKFADKLFHGPGQSASPKFSREEAQEYFGKTYRDEHRDYDYSPMESRHTQDSL